MGKLKKEKMTKGEIRKEISKVEELSDIFLEQGLTSDSLYVDVAYFLNDPTLAIEEIKVVDKIESRISPIE